MKIVVGITGSSGAVYALDFLKKSTARKYVIVSSWGKVLLRDELNMSEKDLAPHAARLFSDDALTAPMASGSNFFDLALALVWASRTSRCFPPQQRTHF